MDTQPLFPPSVLDRAEIVLAVRVPAGDSPHRPCLISVGQAGHLPVFASGPLSNLPTLLVQAWAQLAAALPALDTLPTEAERDEDGTLADVADDDDETLADVADDDADEAMPDAEAAPPALAPSAAPPATRVSATVTRPAAPPAAPLSRQKPVTQNTLDLF